MGVLEMILMAAMVQLISANTVAVRVSQPNSEMYHRQDMKKGEFDYGYHVQTVSNQFQHKVKGPDDVTYGCYGYIDPSHRKHLVYYVADRMGYRIIFPNRPTKIFTAKLSDSLNKLDSSVKGKDYDEKLVAWNDLYLPDSCFRLEDILESASSNQPAPQAVVPAQRPVATVKPVPSPTPPLPSPTQYTIPTPPGRAVDLSGAGSEHYDTGSGFYDGHVDGSTGEQNQPGAHGHQQPQGNWQGSLPDINPANINLDQFNGNVYTIYTGAADPQEQAGAGYSTAEQSGAGHSQAVLTQQNLNITQLLAQIEAVNSQVITLNMLLAGMTNNPTAFAATNENSCRSVVQLLQTQHRSPQLVYVPILIPYIEGQHNINQPIVPGRSGAHRQPQPSRHG